MPFLKDNLYENHFNMEGRENQFILTIYQIAVPVNFIQIKNALI